MGLFSFLKNTGKKIGKQVVDPVGDEFEADAQSLSAKEQQINAGGRQNGVDRIISANDPNYYEQESEVEQPKKFGLLSGLKKAGKFVGDNAEMIMPAVYGLSQGVGVLPGLMYGLAAKNQRKATDLEIAKDAAEKQADLDWKKEMLKQQNEQKELDRQNRIDVKKLPTSNDQQEEERLQNYQKAKEQKQRFLDMGATEKYLDKMHPEINAQILDYEQRLYKKKLGEGETLDPLEVDYEK